MKEPIKPQDIRAGDKIRVEWVTTTKGLPAALEYVAPHSGTAMKKRMSDAEYGSARHFLLDRPNPADELPNEPTLGRLTWYAGEESSGLGIYKSRVGIFHVVPGGLTDEAGAGMWPLADILAFRPLVAVPAKALDRLRRVLDGAFDLPSDSKKDRLAMREEAIRELFAAVDAATGDHA